MKLNFDPKKNIATFDYILMQFNRIKQNISDLLTIRKVVKNWQDVLFFRLGLKHKFTMVLRNRHSVNVNKPEDYFNFWSTGEAQIILLKVSNLTRGKWIKISGRNKIVEFKFEGKMVKFYYDSVLQAANTVFLIKEQFIDEQYKWLDVKDKVVVDIGANVGDTAIYFALKDAKHVYAFEPYPYSYNLAVKNIASNGLKDRITLLNEGCGGKAGFVTLDENYQNTGGTDLKSFDKGKKIRITILDEIVKRFGISKDAVLKIDCEGCEYDTLLRSSSVTLMKFKRIQVEYHYGYINLKKELEGAGFKLSKTRPKLFINFESENNEIFSGSICAERT